MGVNYCSARRQRRGTVFILCLRSVGIMNHTLYPSALERLRPSRGQLPASRPAFTLHSDSFQLKGNRDLCLSGLVRPPRSPLIVALYDISLTGGISTRNAGCLKSSLPPARTDIEVYHLNLSAVCAHTDNSIYCCSLYASLKFRPISLAQNSQTLFIYD